jgi:hypothetical protein
VTTYTFKENKQKDEVKVQRSHKYLCLSLLSGSHYWVRLGQASGSFDLDINDEQVVSDYG